MPVKVNTKGIKKIRDYFLKNPNKTIQEISNELGYSKSWVGEVLDNKEYNIIPSLNTENLYFLFGSILEKSVKTDPYKLVINSFDFNEKEKTFLRSYGFKF
jgi:hypothetical protein